MAKYWIAALLLISTASAARAQWQVVASAIFPPSIPYGYGAMSYKDGNFCVGFGTEIVRSTDLGLTWTQSATQFGSRITDLAFADRNVGIASFLDQVYLTRDGGLNWTGPILNVGSYSVTCLGSPNEFAVGDLNGSFHITTDQGTTWTSTLSPGDWVHRLAIKGNRIYALASLLTGPSTAQASVFLSTDRGTTWQQFAGAVDFDSYSFSIDSCDENNMFVANEGTILSSDGYSQIYVSSDGGASFAQAARDVVPNLSGSVVVAPHSVYCPRITGGILRSTDHGVSWKSIGGPPQPADTRLICAVTDNILFAIDASGSILRTLNSGGDSVIGPLGAVTLSTQNVNNDTIGATIYLPIIRHGTRPIGAVDLSVGFDTTMLIYDGTHEPGGTTDKTTSRGKDHAHVHFDATASTDSILGYATFRIFPRTSACTEVTFDSVNIPLDKIACTSAAPSFKSTVCSKLGCGTPTISDFLRYGKTPQLTITPNPAANTVSLHTDVDLGEASIEIYDVAGVLRNSLHMQLTAAATAQLDLTSLPSGMYTVRVRSAAIDRSISVMHLK